MPRAVPKGLPGWADAVGTSDAFLGFQDHLTRIADSERPVLIMGERGTGKELAAGRIHYMSRRWDKPFVVLLCTALNPNLLEAELFGYEAGAFTGARERRAGYFERADQGTLFLDEVADMPLPLQDKLLRVIEYGVFTRVGGWAEQRTDVRIVAATNRDVRRLAQEEHLRPDLLDRLACEVVHVPPLRVRDDDRMRLAQHFANKMAVELGRDQEGSFPPEGVCFGEEAMRQLFAYTWPGNVRELKNVVERSLVRAVGGVIERLILDPFASPWDRLAPVSVVPPAVPPAGVRAVVSASEAPGHMRSAAGPVEVCAVSPPLAPEFSLPRALDDLERAAVQAALEQTHYRQTDAARLLGLSYHQFRGVYKKWSATFAQNSKVKI